MAKNKALLPTDGSLAAKRAAVYAARLMKLDPEMEVDVLVVVPSKGLWGGNEEEILQKTINIFSSQGLPVRGYIKFGDPAAVILQEAVRGNYDHIIMGSRGAGEVKDSGVGSVSHQVINQAACRVTLVK